MNLKPYPEYKDSGVAWLGDVPKHWNLSPNKIFFKKRNEIVGENNSQYTLLSLTLRGVIKRDLVNAKGKFPAKFDTYQVVYPNDFIFCLFDVDETPRTVGISPYYGMITGAYSVFAPKKPESRFLYYLFLSLDNQKALKPIYTGLRKVIPEDSFLRIKIPDLSVPEQTAIARFLDYKTSQIARFIKAKKRMIELLKEQKQVIINDAVTGKIVIKDEGGRLKAEKRPDSSFIPHPSSFLQTVPEGWEVKKLKHLYQNINEQTNKKLDDEIYLALENVESWSAKITLSDEEIKFESQVKKFQEGDILFGKLRPYLAKVVKPNFKGVCVGEFLVLRKAADDVVPNYLELKLRSKVIIDVINQSTFGAKMPRADWGFIGNLMLSIPSIQEQHQIASYIETKTAALDLTISRTEREISLMQEYRTRLISDVVTGKVDVRDIKIPEIADIDDTIAESIDEPETVPDPDIDDTEELGPELEGE